MQVRSLLEKLSSFLKPYIFYNWEYIYDYVDGVRTEKENCKKKQPNTYTAYTNVILKLQICIMCICIILYYVKLNFVIIYSFKGNISRYNVIYS